MNIKSIRCGQGFCIFVTIAFALNFSLQQAMAACTLTPARQTNTVGAIHSVTAHLTTNDIGVAGVPVSFAITSGPNNGLSASLFTDASGNVDFNYRGNGGVGTDIIQATGTVDGVAFTCLATQVWVSAAVPPTIQCPDNIVMASDPEGCSRSVTFAPVASGSPIPTVRCRIGTDPIVSPHVFSVGTTTVSCTASNANGTNICSFTVTITESTPPEITCPNDLFATAGFGEGGAIVTFDDPAATDNCGNPVIACVPASGSFFPVGATTVTCTATDNAGNSNTCTFVVTVEETQPEAHDLAVVKIKAPRFINLNAAPAALTKRVVVTIQNRSAHTERIDDPARFAALVTLAVQSFDTNACPDITPVFLERAPQRRLPFILKPKGKLNVYFDVTFDCAVNPSKGFGQEDFSYFAKVNHEAIDDLLDTHTECDVCPRPPLDGGVDPNPDGRIKDKGCGAARGDGTFGNDVLTDVFVR
jgi:hypothetical protein